MRFQSPWQNFVKKRKRAPYQSRVVEDGFLRERRAEAKSSSTEVSNAGLLEVLLKKKVLEQVYSFNALQVRHEIPRYAKLADSAFHATANKCSIDISGIRGTQKDPPLGGLEARHRAPQVCRDASVRQMPRK